jgi:hypothetical protein
MRIRTHLWAQGVVALSLLLSGCSGGGSSDVPPAQVTVNVQGVPANLDADVTMYFYDGPNTQSWTITHTSTISNLQAGAYVLKSNAFDDGWTRYEVVEGSNVNFSLAAGESKTVDVVYQSRAIMPGKIAFTFDTSNLPAGASYPPLMLEGPNGFSQTIDADIVVEGLLPGQYDITAQDFTVQNANYAIYLTAGSVALNENEQINVTATVVPVPVRVKSLENKESGWIDGTVDPAGNRYSTETIYTVIPPSQGGVFATTKRQNMLHKWAPDGSLVWSKAITDQIDDEWLWRVATDEEGSVYLAGWLPLANLFSSGSDSAAELRKYDADGNLVWETTIPRLFTRDDPHVGALAVNNGLITVFAHTYASGDLSGVISVHDAATGANISSLVDTTVNSGFSQLQTASDGSYWLVEGDRIVRYSPMGEQLQALDIGPVAGFVPNVGFTLDDQGGLFVVSLVSGTQDTDVQLSHYLADLSLDWQQVVTHPGEEGLGQPVMGYDAASGRLLIQFTTDGFFTGYESAAQNVEPKWQSVVSEWTTTGTMLWLRQLPVSVKWGLVRIQRINTQDWYLENTLDPVHDQYGLGNVIVIGP